MINDDPHFVGASATRVAPRFVAVVAHGVVADGVTDPTPPPS